MFWIGAGSTIIIILSIKSFINNKKRWQNRQFYFQSSRLYFWLLQGGNILLIVAGILFLMLAIVCHVRGFELQFSSEYAYHMQINGS